MLNTYHPSLGLPCSLEFYSDGGRSYLLTKVDFEVGQCEMSKKFNVAILEISIFHEKSWMTITIKLAEIKEKHEEIVSLKNSQKSENALATN